MNRDDVVDELGRAAADFRALVLSASDIDLGRGPTAPGGPTGSCSGYLRILGFSPSRGGWR